MARDRDRDRDRSDGLEDRVVKIRRCAAVVKGGRRFSFNALVVVGDGKGRVAYGYGKANEVPPAVEKATKDAAGTHASVKRASRCAATRFRTASSASSARSQVVLVPAGPGTGVKAGPGVRDVLVACGMRNILTKMHGSTNPINLVKATIDGLHAAADPRGSGHAARSDSLMDLHGTVSPDGRCIDKRKPQEARRPRHRQRARQDRAPAAHKGQWASAGAEQAALHVRRRPDAAVPPHAEARLQPRDLGQVLSTSSTSATSTRLQGRRHGRSRRRSKTGGLAQGPVPTASVFSATAS